MPDPDVTLEQLEGAWPDPGPDATHLVRTAQAARRVPIGALSVEQLRLLIGQDVSVDALLPYAVDRLVADPLAEGDYYPGDLLAAVLRLPASAWAGHADRAAALSAVLRTVDPHEPDLLDNPRLAADVVAFLGS